MCVCVMIESVCQSVREQDRELSHLNLNASTLNPKFSNRLRGEQNELRESQSVREQELKKLQAQVINPG